MTLLTEEIRVIIETEGPMPFDRFMELCLAHPRHGYYLTRDPFGASGDFVTAPEISQVFGELLGLWAAHMWSVMGRPERLRLVELGPGRGTLMSDALRACRVAPEFLAALDVHMIETSPVLRERQQETLAAAPAPVSWAPSFDLVPEGPLIVLANEFFDALPVRHFVRAEEGWCEKLIGNGADGRLFAGISPVPEPLIRAQAPIGSVLEIGAAAHQYMARVARRIADFGGAALIVDYGHAHTSLGETVQALWRHQPIDPLEAPGECDVTAHVDFASLARAAQASGAEVWGPTTQAQFLIEIGVLHRAEALKRRAEPAQAAEIDLAVARLVSTAPEAGAGGRMAPGMGALFKALTVTSPGLGKPPGFDAPPPELAPELAPDLAPDEAAR